MWTPTTRQQHSRPITRYQTDLTDAEWRVIAPHLPKPCAMGRPREWPMREIINGSVGLYGANSPRARGAPTQQRWSAERPAIRPTRWRRLLAAVATIFLADSFLVLHRALPDLRRMKHKPDQPLGHREVFLFLPTIFGWGRTMELGRPARESMDKEEERDP